MQNHLVPRTGEGRSGGRILQLKMQFHFKITEYLTILNTDSLTLSPLALRPNAGHVASSCMRFLDHTQRRTTVGRTPLHKWTGRRRNLYRTTLTADKHPCPRRDSNPPQQASGRRPMTLTARPLGPAFSKQTHTHTHTHTHTNYAYINILHL